jgi:hypothetical protein
MGGPILAPFPTERAEELEFDRWTVEMLFLSRRKSFVRR